MKKKNVEYKIAYYDETGKRRGKTFTAPTLKEAQMKAATWELLNKRERRPKLTVAEAVERYIDLKRPVLSPSTIRAYVSVYEQRIKPHEIGKMDAMKLSSMEAQVFISDLSAQYSQKTVKNVYGLLYAAIKMHRPDVSLNVTMPPKIKKEVLCPSDDEILQLINYVRSVGNLVLLRAIYLAAFGGLRRGEICALTDKDIKGTQAHVSKSMVLSETRTWEIKPPKTFDSDRYVDLPGAVLESFKGVKGRLVPISPDSLTQMFRVAVKNAGLPPYHIHMLRSYNASAMHAIGIPDIYIMKHNGWSSPSVMNSHYKKEIARERDKNSARAMQYFDGLLADV